jgi:hypothetical protein
VKPKLLRLHVICTETREHSERLLLELFELWVALAHKYAAGVFPVRVCVDEPVAEETSGLTATASASKEDVMHPRA